METWNETSLEDERVCPVPSGVDAIVDSELPSLLIDGVGQLPTSRIWNRDRAHYSCKLGIKTFKKFKECADYINSLTSGVHAAWSCNKC